MINEFTGRNRFLSNFFMAPVSLDGIIYPSVENAYQAAKTSSPSSREPFVNCTPGQAKRMGRMIPLRAGWDDMKIDVMRDLIRQKFAHGSNLGDYLLGTEDEELIEGNTWGDVFWGVCNGRGENHLGKLLMDRRTSLRRIVQIEYWNNMPPSASALERRAALFSAVAHDGQRRKGANADDYIVHPAAVVEILRTVLDPNDQRTHIILAAAWLHDVAEDTSVTLDDIRREFGDDVADIVGMVTNPSRPEDGNRAARKAIDRAHLMRADDRGKLIKLGDVIQNLSTVMDVSHGFAQVYVQEKKALLDSIHNPDLPLMDQAWCMIEFTAERVGLDIRRPDGFGLGVSVEFPMVMDGYDGRYMGESGAVSASIGLQL